MKIYLVSQNKNNGYDSYDSFVVVAPDVKTAKRTYPSNYRVWVEGKGWHSENVHYGLMKDEASSWVEDLKDIKVKVLGEALPSMKPGVVCASFNAG